LIKFVVKTDPIGTPTKSFLKSQRKNPLSNSSSYTSLVNKHLFYLLCKFIFISLVIDLRLCQSSLCQTEHKLTLFERKYSSFQLWFIGDKNR
jgi:hypothetical protein